MTACSRSGSTGTVCADAASVAVGSGPDRLRRMPTVRDRLAAPGPHFSVEFMPPRTDADEDVLWRAVRRLEPLRPAFVSVTYGAGGSHRERTIRVTQRIAEETTLLPVAHLTAVGHSVAELRQVIGSYAAVGVREHPRAAR